MEPEFWDGYSMFATRSQKVGINNRAARYLGALPSIPNPGSTGNVVRPKASPSIFLFLTSWALFAIPYQHTASYILQLSDDSMPQGIRRLRNPRSNSTM